ncbi:hypothetical protein [uncultured Chitinophaga sp.]|uniref:hypothetical protein n=1 Tax=uncultured Chitinophaga sp. TaxID=339340 RepID=UPI0025CD1085|nr:hypothetical protein [uncultured Chitinophaga sp.]
MILRNYNAISSGATGQFAGQVVVRKRYGQIEITKMPCKRPGKGTEAQEAERQRWKGANDYYRRQVKFDKQRTALYKNDIPRDWNVQNRAVSDYYHAPEITDVNTTAYTGHRGDVIHVTATDDFMVERVHVAIYDINGELVEDGYALKGEGDEWVYRARCNNKGGGRIEVVAGDMPGNEDRVLLQVKTEMEVILEAVGMRGPVPVKHPVKAFIWKRGSSVGKVNVEMPQVRQGAG